MSGIRSTQVGADGAFSFTDVSPGAYTVLARATVPARDSVRGGADHLGVGGIAVDGEPISGLSLGLQPGMTLAGQLRFEGTRLKPPADLKSVRITVQPVQPQGTVSFAPPARDRSPRRTFRHLGYHPRRVSPRRVVSRVRAARATGSCAPRS